MEEKIGLKENIELLKSLNKDDVFIAFFRGMKKIVCETFRDAIKNRDGYITWSINGVKLYSEITDLFSLASTDSFGYFVLAEPVGEHKNDYDLEVLFKVTWDLLLSDNPEKMIKEYKIERDKRISDKIKSKMKYLSELNPGDKFEYEGEIYIRTDEHKTLSCSKVSILCVGIKKGNTEWITWDNKVMTGYIN